MPMSGKNIQDIGLYFHIPFCSKKCDYCHFYVLPDKEAFHLQLMEGLQWEWERWLPSLQGRRLASVYFGGGTPSLLGPERIGTLIDWARSAFPEDLPQSEITLEANPENITLEKMAAFRQAGINRVSLGIQTFDAPLLQLLGRTHSPGKGEEAVYLTREAGIGNISIDLMYDLPRQDMQRWRQTLQKAAGLPITHLSLYNLTIEPHTVFFKYQESIRKLMPDPDISTEMYTTAIEVLEEAGLMQYEISAFARDGLMARHNSGYWTGRPFLGFGPSAFSFWEGKRFRNIANLSRYHRMLQNGESPVDFSEALPPDALLREKLAINLRLREGVDLSEYSGLGQETQYALERCKQMGWIEQRGERIALTSKGLLFYDSVAEELV
jgi:oxygen-independent coproporphyrinogen-3 oxidase